MMKRTIHFLVNMLDQRLAPRQNPLVHDVSRQLRFGVVLELDAVILFEDRDVGGEEVVGVKPRQEDSRKDSLDAFLLEEKVVASDDGRVDEEETNGIGSVALDNLVGIRVVFQRLGHFTTVTEDSMRGQRRNRDMKGRQERRKNEKSPDRMVSFFLPYESRAKATSERQNPTHAARTRPLTVTFFQGAVSKR